MGNIKENKKLQEKIVSLGEKKKKLTQKTNEAKKKLAKIKSDLGIEKGILDDMKKDKNNIRSKITDFQDLGKEQGKKLKSEDEVKGEITKNLSESKLKGDNIVKETNIINDEIKSRQSEFDDIKMRIQKMEVSIKKQEKDIETHAGKIQEVSGKIDKKGEEKAVDDKSKSIMKLNPMEKTVEKAKDALKDVLDPSLQVHVEEAYNIAIDKQNNDLNTYLKKLKNLPTAFVS